MKYVILVLVSFASITSALCADVSNNSRGWYVQPSVVYLAERADFKSVWSGALSTGFAFNEHHAVELELMAFKTDSLIIPASGYSYAKDLKVIPVIFTYRYTFVLGKGFGLFGGVSTQAMYQDTNYTYYYGPSGPPAGSLLSETTYSLTIGGQIGLTYDFSPRVTMVAAVKFLRVVDEPQYTIFEFGLRYRF